MHTSNLFINVGVIWFLYKNLLNFQTYFSHNFLKELFIHSVIIAEWRPVVTHRRRLRPIFPNSSSMSSPRDRYGSSTTAANRQLILVFRRCHRSNWPLDCRSTIRSWSEQWSRSSPMKEYDILWPFYSLNWETFTVIYHEVKRALIWAIVSSLDFVLSLFSERWELWNERDGRYAIYLSSVYLQ